jgi:hypothetical protein
MYGLFILGVAILFIVPAVTHRVARRRMSQQIERVRHWQNLPDAVERESCIWEFIRDYHRQQALLYVLLAPIIIAALAFMAGSLWVIHDIAEDAKGTANVAEQAAMDVADLAAENCRLNRNFLQDEADDATSDIRRRQNDRDELAQDIVDTPGELTEIPGYFDAPFWFQQFLGNLLEQQVAEGNQALGVMDAELAELRQRRDALQELLNDQTCPRQ